MIHRLFTWLSTPRAPAPDALLDLLDRVRSLEVQVRELRSDVELVDVALSKLRGRVTGGIRYQQQPQPGDRDSLRRLAGIKPGRPYQHGE